MNRQIIYSGAIPSETDILHTEKHGLIGLAKLAEVLFGTSPGVNGLSVISTYPTSLQVLVNPGQIYSMAPVDSTSYSSLASDNHSVLKQGLLLDAIAVSCPAPGTSGQSINYLIQATYQDLDGVAAVLPYYNASNPSVALNGPGGSNTAQNTVRQGICSVTAKAGTAAATGTQATPNPDAGNIGIAVVTVENGQTAIDASCISAYSGIVHARVQNVVNADHAGSADSATNADHAGSADTAGTATNAESLGGEPASTYTTGTELSAAVTALNEAITAAINALVIPPGVPAGTIFYFAATNPPTGYLVCDGSQVSRTNYAALFSAVGTTFGAGDGTNTFTLPDLRGEFVRAWDTGAGLDTGRVFGSVQADELASHNHNIYASNWQTAGGSGGMGYQAHERPWGNTELAGGTETRPHNVALLGVIKY